MSVILVVAVCYLSISALPDGTEQLIAGGIDTILSLVLVRQARHGIPLPGRREIGHRKLEARLAEAARRASLPLSELAESDGRSAGKSTNVANLIEDV